jgi:hypothetical protein
MTSRQVKALLRVKKAALRLTRAVDALPAKDLPLVLRLTLSGARLCADNSVQRLGAWLDGKPVNREIEGG